MDLKIDTRNAERGKQTPREEGSRWSQGAVEGRFRVWKRSGRGMQDALHGAGC